MQATKKRKPSNLEYKRRADLLTKKSLCVLSSSFSYEEVRLGVLEHCMIENHLTMLLR